MSRPSRRAGLGIAAGCTLAVASGWNIGNVGSVASDLAHAYGVGLVVVGLFTTALFVTHAAVQVPGGRASDRFGPARAGAAALAAICAGDLLALTAPEPAIAIAARAITGVGTGVAFVGGSALVRESGGSPFAQGVFGGIGLGAGGLALATLPHLEDAIGWRAPYWSSLALALAALALVTVAPRARARDALAPGPRDEARAAGVLRDRRLHRLALLYSASYGLSVVLGNWVVELLDRHTALGHGTAAVVGGLTLLLGVVTRPLGGWVLRAHPQRARTALAVSLAAGGLGTLALLAAGPGWLAAAGGLLVGVGAGMPFAAAFTGAAVTRPDAPGAAVGLVNGVANVVVLAGTPLVGVTFSLAGGGRIGFAVIAALWLAALAVLPGREGLGVTRAQPAARPARGARSGARARR